MRTAISQLLHDLRNAFGTADLHLQALGRAREAAPRSRHLLGARRALAEGAGLVDRLAAALPEQGVELHGNPEGSQ